MSVITFRAFPGKKLGYRASKMHVIESRPKARNPDNLATGARVNPLLSPFFITGMYIFGVAGGLVGVLLHEHRLG